LGLFPLIGASANCSSYQNPRRQKNLTILGIIIGLGSFKTDTGAVIAQVLVICNCTCFI